MFRESYIEGVKNKTTESPSNKTTPAATPSITTAATTAATAATSKAKSNAHSSTTTTSPSTTKVSHQKTQQQVNNQKKASASQQQVNTHTPTATTKPTPKSQNHLDIIKDTRIHVKSGLSLSYSSLSNFVNAKDDHPVCALAPPSSEYASFPKSNMTACRWNAVQKFSGQKLNELINLSTQNVIYGLASRALDSDVHPNNLSMFSGIAFTLPPNQQPQSPVFNKYLTYNHPSNAVNTVYTSVIAGTHSIEWFGYIVVKSDSPTSSVTATAVNAPTGSTLYMWIGPSAVVNYNSQNTMTNMSISSGALHPIRLQLFLNATAPANISVQVQSKGSIGLYSIVDGRGGIVVMNEYLYSLDSNNTCYLYESNAILQDQTYTEVKLSSIQFNNASGVSVSISDKMTNGVVTGATLEIITPSSTQTSKTTKHGSNTQTQTVNTTSAFYDISGMKGYHISNPQWISLSISGANNNSSGSTSQSFPVYSSGGYFYVTYDSVNLNVYAWMKNPKCSGNVSALSTPNVAQTYTYGGGLGINSYTVFDSNTNTKTLVETIPTDIKSGVGLDKIAYSNDSGQWDSYKGLDPTTSNSGFLLDKKATNATSCLANATSNGASSAAFISTNGKTGSCYYSKQAPTNGSYMNLYVAPNNSSTLYIRKALWQGEMAQQNKLQAANYGDAFKQAKEVNNIPNALWNTPITQNLDTVAKAKMDKILNESFTTVDCGTAGSGSGNITYGNASILSSCNAYNYGGLANDSVPIVNSGLSNLNIQLQGLQTAYQQSPEANTVLPSPDTIGYANEVYKILHPNSSSTSEDAYQLDINEMRMQYNNMFMIGSIAAATFGIGAIVALSFR